MVHGQSAAKPAIASTLLSVSSRVQPSPSAVPRRTGYSKRWIDNPGPDEGCQHGRTESGGNRAPASVAATAATAAIGASADCAAYPTKTRGTPSGTGRRVRASIREPASHSARGRCPDIHHLRCGERDRAADGGTSELSHCPLALGQCIVRSVTSGQRPGAYAAGLLRHWLRPHWHSLARTPVHAR